MDGGSKQEKGPDHDSVTFATGEGDVVQKMYFHHVTGSDFSQDCPCDDEKGDDDDHVAYQRMKVRHMTGDDVSLDCPSDEGGDDDGHMAYQRIKVRYTDVCKVFLCRSLIVVTCDIVFVVVLNASLIRACKFLDLQESLGCDNNCIITHSVTLCDMTVTIKALLVEKKMYIYVDEEVVNQLHCNRSW